MYTYNKNDKSYTFSFDELDIEKLIDANENDSENNNSSNESQEKPKKIEVINGGNDLNISPVTDYLEVEKPKNEKKENIVIPENNG